MWSVFYAPLIVSFSYCSCFHHTTSDSTISQIHQLCSHPRASALIVSLHLDPLFSVYLFMARTHVIAHPSYLCSSTWSTFPITTLNEYCSLALALSILCLLSLFRSVISLLLILNLLVLQLIHLLYLLGVFTYKCVCARMCFFICVRVHVCRRASMWASG